VETSSIFPHFCFLDELLLHKVFLPRPPFPRDRPGGVGRPQTSQGFKGNRFRYPSIKIHGLAGTIRSPWWVLFISSSAVPTLNLFLSLFSCIGPNFLLRKNPLMLFVTFYVGISSYTVRKGPSTRSATSLTACTCSSAQTF